MGRKADGRLKIRRTIEDGGKKGITGSRKGKKERQIRKKKKRW